MPKVAKKKTVQEEGQEGEEEEIVGVDLVNAYVAGRSRV